jgi:hypothetical protein
MHRGRSFTFTLARIALAYVLALQALLGAFAGLAVAGDSQSVDTSLSLCRTLADGSSQPTEDHTGLGSHCALMCLSGACAAGDPPAAASVAAEFSPHRATFTSNPAVDDRPPSAAPGFGKSARGPPSVG